ncbi:MAG: PspC domain-containing protein [Acholeplasmatales bacterium]|nr:MAG: PspC domain-containing protein [Acholeplasmatales bacterium]
MSQVKRLYRNDKDTMISGVCSGLADYLGADPTLVRVLAVLALFMTGGTALIGYIILAIVVPTKSSLVEKGEIIDDTKRDPKNDYTIDPEDYKL